MEPGRGRDGVSVGSRRRHASVAAGPNAKKLHPIRFAGREPPGMSDEMLTRIVRAMRANPRKGRGAIYRWLWTHHAHLSQALAETDAGWQEIAAAMAATGLVGRRGNPPTRKSLPKVWKRVCRDVAAEAERTHASAGAVAWVGEPRMPSKTAPGRRPLEASATVPRPPATGSSTAPISPIGAADHAAPAHRPLRVFRSLADIRPPQQAASEPDAAPEPGAAGMLPPPRWPKPVM